jgi:SAM-dependent methyltransferase
MPDSTNRFRDYWNQRYQAEGEIWGDRPSSTAVHAAELFQNVDAKSILVPGSGYGRNTRYFSTLGFDVTGVEISPVAVALAREFDANSTFYLGSVLDMSFDSRIYDAIYCFNVLHLFLEHDRKVLIQECSRKLAENGHMFFTVFSEREPDFGKGKEVEANTFESRPGRPAHYFTEEDLERHFYGYRLLESGIAEDPENHGGKPHIHLLRYIYIRR